jgi:Tol biopolymer transport system component
MRKSLIPTIAFSSLILTGCYFFKPTRPYSVINLLSKPDAPAIVAEEGPLSLSKLTEYTSEPAYGPSVSVSSIGSYWTPGRYITVNSSGDELYFVSERNGSVNIFQKNLGSNNRSSTQKTFRSSASGMCLSKDDKTLTFADYSSANVNIMSTSTSGGTAVSQTTWAEGSEVNPEYSDDGKSLYYAVSNSVVTTTGDPAIRYYIWGTNLATNVQTQYTEGQEPSSINKSTDLLISRKNYTTNQREIWRVDIVNGKETLLLNDRNISYGSPIASPDGKKMAFVGVSPKTKTTPINLNIFVANIDGSKITQLTYHPGVDCSPVWGPKGDKLYFISTRTNKNNNYSIWQMTVPSGI